MFHASSPSSQQRSGLPVWFIVQVKEIPLANFDPPGSAKTIPLFSCAGEKGAVTPCFRSHTTFYFYFRKMWLYFISFVLLFLAEICQTLHSIFIVKDNKHMAALFGAISSAFWCVKIVVVVSQPTTIVTAFIGAWLGSYCAFMVEKKLKR